METGIPDSAHTPANEQNLRNIVLALYIMYMAGLFTGGLSFFVALIMGHVKKIDSRGTIYHSHISAFLRVAWINVMTIVVFAPMSVFLLFYMADKDMSGIATLLFLTCLCGMIIEGIWSVYRIAKGIWRWSESRAVV